MKQHKWHKEIKAWADGAEIEFREYKRDKALDRYVWSNWNDNFFPEWLLTNVEYRIKPRLKENICKHGFQQGKCTLGEKDCNESRYLYVYYNSEKCEFELETRILTNPYLRCIGKIKLEDE